MELQEIRKKLKKTLEKGRYEHTKGVMYTAGCLAMAHGYSIEKAMLAGLLHDCAKCIPYLLCPSCHFKYHSIYHHHRYHFL